MERVVKTSAEVQTSTRMGVQKDYVEGLDNLRKMVTDLQCDVDKLKRQFYCCDANTNENFEGYLKNCNQKLANGNTKLRKKDVQLQVVDSEIQLVAMLNKLRELDENVDKDVVKFLTDFWKHLKETVESLQGVCVNFKRRVLKRLNTSCLSYNNGIQLELTITYNEVVSKYQKEIQQTLKNFEVLAKSFSNGIRQELYSKTSFTDRVIVICDLKAFPILRLVPDLTEKMVHVSTLSTQWIDKDETYIYDINNHIREARNQSRRMEQDLRIQNKKKEEMHKSVDNAFDMFKSNKRKLQKIDDELQNLEAQMEQCTETKKYKTEEHRQKEGMVGFLEISITQTKKTPNISLQLKKARLVRQLKELEQNLKVLEQELTTVEQDVKHKEEKRDQVKKKFDESTNSYTNLKSDMERFTVTIEKLQQDVSELTLSLTELETIRTFKTSPEKVEDLYDRPTSVKLAPSLKEKIARRKRKLLSGDTGDS